mmetsp:Transcript_2782/g.9571  ORF Transcript_2782/g.9571 Transcript_2782/m.9571 type:complete len:225 (+) Transcript_2782:510-1184(+)
MAAPPPGLRRPLSNSSGGGNGAQEEGGGVTMMATMKAEGGEARFYMTHCAELHFTLILQGLVLAGELRRASWQIHGRGDAEGWARHLLLRRRDHDRWRNHLDWPQQRVCRRGPPQLELPRLLAQGALDAPKVDAAVSARLFFEVVRLPDLRPGVVRQARGRAAAEEVDPEESAAVRREVPLPRDTLLVLSVKDRGNEVADATNLAVIATREEPRRPLGRLARYG